jgi:hypothetical protein
MGVYPNPAPVYRDQSSDQAKSVEQASTRRKSMADHEKGEAESEAEVERQAARVEEDPITSREALEEELMEEGHSEAGEHIP